MTDTERLTEDALKCLFLEHLRRRGTIDSDTVVASEYALGRGGRRIDLAIWNGEFIGVEFKSRFDTLKRLAPQLDAYLKCFDRVILVTDERHQAVASVTACTQVEIWTVDSSGCHTQIQQPGIIRSQTVEALANLCSLAQLRRIAPPNGREGYRGRSNIATGELPHEAVYAAAIEGFKRLFADSSHTFWDSVGENQITRSHLDLLSRFAELRARRNLILNDERRFWEAWTQQALQSLRRYAVS